MDWFGHQAITVGEAADTIGYQVCGLFHRIQVPSGSLRHGAMDTADILLSRVAGNEMSRPRLSHRSSLLSYAARLKIGTHRKVAWPTSPNNANRPKLLACPHPGSCLRSFSLI